jgi:hypothetical protein
MLPRGTVKRASMVPPRDIMTRAGCERNVEDDFLAGEIVRPLGSIRLFTHTTTRALNILGEREASRGNAGKRYRSLWTAAIFAPFTFTE